MSTKAHEPAHPTVTTNHSEFDQQIIVTDYIGMTKREMFAMHLYSGILVGDDMTVDGAKKLAEWAVLCADALITELNK